jgi:hypothetical protein
MIPNNEKQIVNKQVDRLKNRICVENKSNLMQLIPKITHIFAAISGMVISDFALLGYHKQKLII